MSNQDKARLSAWERAALAELENAASAEDPRLDGRLQRGARRMPSLPFRTLRWRHSAALGALVAVVGLAFVALSLSVGFVLGVAGAILTTIGLAFSFSAIRRRIHDRLV
jgi:hypothetical protein